MLETLKPERGLSGGGGGYGVPGKYKPRRLSAQRDFPRDCGRFAIRSNANQRDKNPVDVDSPIVKPDVVKTSVSSSDSQKLELNTNLDAKETIILPEVLECEIRKHEKDLYKGEVLTAKESVEPLVIVTDLSNQMEVAEFVKDSEKSSQIGDNEQQCSTMDAIMTDVETPLNVSDEPETSLHNIGSMRVMYPPRRKTSAVRDFPPNCGRNALVINQKEPMKLAAQLENQNIETSGGNLPPEHIVRDRKVRDIVKDEEDHRRKLKKSVMKDFVDNVRVKSERDIMKVTHENVQVQLVRQSKLEKDEEINVMSPAVSDLPKSNMKSLSLSKAVGRDIANLGGKLEKESFKINKDNNFKRNVSEVVQGEDSSSVFSNDREIVMALMAAQNCPWTQLQTKHGFKSTDHGTTKEKVSKHESIVHARQKKGADSSEEKSTKRNDSFEISNYMVAEDEENSSEYNGESENLSLALKPQDHTMSLIPFGLHSLLHEDDNNGGAATRNQVRETLRLFQAIFRKLLRDEEAKSKEKGISCGRIDLNSAKILKEKRKWVNTGKSIVGIVPGVEVGDEFHWRVELAIIGLHRPYIGGIDYVKNGKGRVLATSIVASGCYAGDMDSSDILIYSGQGGNRVSGEKAEDQKLERGNLGLKNSMDDNSPVRVIRGFKETKASDSVDTRGKMVATYIYDGLYMVERYWQEKGRYGNNVFMFRLSRIPGQPELAWKEVKKSKKLRVREGLCVDDITQGKEKMPICAVNTIDNEKPPPFKYITSMIYPSCYELTTPNGCECVDGCSDTEKCICAVRNGGEIPFNYNGAIVEAKPLVYECGPFCKCPPSCHNRVSQKGIKFQLEIFKTESRGWGVRSLTSIPSGSFICEYTGELLEDKEAEQRTGNDEYLFDIGSNYNDQTLWDGLSNLVPPELQPCYSYETVEDVGFTIDAAEYGSVGRFINHSCSPNLYAQNVLYDHGDKRMPHIMLFAAENIPPLQELTYHYNYVVDQVRDSSGNIKKKNCYCGSSECTGRLY